MTEQHGHDARTVDDVERVARAIAERTIELGNEQGDNCELTWEVIPEYERAAMRQLARAAIAALAPAPDATDALRVENERLRAEMHHIKRTCEMSAGIMRDRRRTGGWDGAERTADAFDRVARRAEAALAPGARND